MPHYCAYSFHDLFKAATKRELTSKESKKFSILNQTERNNYVRTLVQKAGWSCEDVKGWDGNIYTAFWPSR